MKHSIATVSMSGTLPEKLQAVAEAGFHGVEIFENDLLYFNGSPKDIRSMCQELGLEIMLFQPFRDFEGGPRSRLARQLDRAERKFDLMAELGCNRILVCSSVSPHLIKDDAVIASDFHQLAERAAPRGIHIGYEALAWGRYVNSYRHVWKIVQAVSHPNLGIILDSFHTLAIHDDLSRLAAIPPEKITFIQLADAPLRDMNVLEWSRHFRNFPGQGDLDVAAFMAPIIQNGYQGPISLEIFNDYFRASPCAQTAKDARLSLNYLENEIRERLSASASAPVSAALISLPPAPQTENIEFLEFAVDYHSGKALGQTLEKLGFSSRGEHKSKDVSLCQQGSIRIILNREPDAFARSYYHLHGPSLCAAAFQVDNSGTAQQRATALGAQAFRSRISENERRIPAITAPNGSLSYFIDRQTAANESADFIPANAPLNQHLTQIDHLSLGMPADQLGSWTLYLRSMLGLTPENEQAVADPYGLISSQVLRSQNGGVRIILNASTAPNTLLSQSIQTYRGSGLQHIAFRCQDIFAAAAFLRAQGAALLDIPANYYDDLQARFGLSDNDTAKLKASHILYDADDSGGEFLHLYTLPFAGRFFFEIVERRGGYDGYGAPNASVRLAALSRLQQSGSGASC